MFQYPTDVHLKHFNNFLLLSTFLQSICCNNLKLEQFFVKNLHFTKNFLHSLQIITRSNFFFIYFYVYVQELFSVSWKNLLTVEHFSYPLVNEHSITLLLLLKLRFTSFTCCQFLVLSFRSQHHLKIDSL